jgi:hypothetical protein
VPNIVPAPRALDALIPLIQASIQTGYETARDTGALLTEAKQQLAHGQWAAWLSEHFAMAQQTANRYMRLAQIERTRSLPANTPTPHVFPSQRAALQRDAEARAARPLAAAERRTAPARAQGRLNAERQSEIQDVRALRQLANELITAGYRVLAARLHPDQGGSHAAMQRLNRVKHLLKESVNAFA